MFLIHLIINIDRFPGSISDDHFGFKRQFTMICWCMKVSYVIAKIRVYYKQNKKMIVKIIILIVICTR